jgi:hypothetical protein
MGIERLSSMKLTCSLHVSRRPRLFTHNFAVNLRKRHSWKLMLAGKTSSQNLTIESHGTFAHVRSLCMLKALESAMMSAYDSAPPLNYSKIQFLPTHVPEKTEPSKLYL